MNASLRLGRMHRFPAAAILLLNHFLVTLRTRPFFHWLISESRPFRRELPPEILDCGVERLFDIRRRLLAV